jgi:hypothetical protein
MRSHSPDEKARILQRGGRVFAVEYGDGIDGPPTARVWLGHMDVPGLVTARPLGGTVAHSAGVISELEFTSHTFSDADKAVPRVR